MQKLGKLFILSILVMSLFSCGFPQQTEPTEDLVATQVVILLTETALHETLPADETPLPTITEAPIEASQTPTTTATPTETPTQTPTQTQVASDPAVFLGAPAWTYEFSGTSSPWDFETDQALFETTGGFLNATARENSNWHSWWVSSPKLKDAYVEMTFQMGACAGFDRFGLAVRGSSDGEQFYFLDLTCDGRWGFFRMAPDVEILEIKAYQETEALENGWSDPHRAGIWMDGSDFRFYVDGEEIGVASDDTLVGEGYTGFMIAYAETPGYSVKVDQLQYWNIP